MLPFSHPKQLQDNLPHHNRNRGGSRYGDRILQIFSSDGLKITKLLEHKIMEMRTVAGRVHEIWSEISQNRIAVIVSTKQLWPATPKPDDDDGLKCLVRTAMKYAVMITNP
jgi:hypothetical protein